MRARRLSELTTVGFCRDPGRARRLGGSGPHSEGRWELVGAGGRGGGHGFDGEAASRLPGGCGWPCLGGLAWPLGGFLEELPCGLFFPLTPCFLFLIVLPAWCHHFPSPPVQAGCVYRGFIFKGRGRRSEQVVFPRQRFSLGCTLRVGLPASAMP